MLQQAGGHQEAEGEEAAPDTCPSPQEIQVHGAQQSLHQALLPCCLPLGAKAIQHSTPAQIVKFLSIKINIIIV